MVSNNLSTYMLKFTLHKLKTFSGNEYLSNKKWLLSQRVLLVAKKGGMTKGISVIENLAKNLKILIFKTLKVYHNLNKYGCSCSLISDYTI